MGNGRSILLIDDDKDFRLAVRAGLERAGFHVLESASGELGLALVVGTRPDAVILDVGLQGQLDGLAVCRAIRASRYLCQTRVLLLSGRNSPGDVTAGLQRGADRYLTKPVAFDDLISHLDELLSMDTSHGEWCEAVR